MPKPPDDMMLALGAPKAPAKEGGGYLAGKSPELRGYLEDATNDTLSPEARAEALCRAIEFTGGDEAEAETDPGLAPVEDDGDY